MIKRISLHRIANHALADLQSDTSSVKGSAKAYNVKVSWAGIEPISSQ